MKKLLSFLLAFQVLFQFPAAVLAEGEETLQDPPQDEQVEDIPNEPVPENEPEPLLEEPEIKIVLNEILPDPLESDAENEFIELYNAGEAEVDLAGWSLDDVDLDDEDIYHFDNPELNYVLEPDGYLTLFRPETNITLNNTGDMVYLFDDQGDEIDYFEYLDSSAGRSWGRNLENPEEWILLPSPSPDEANEFLNDPPTAVITLQGGTENMSINVTGEDSSDPNGDKLSYVWEFEPGVTEESKNPLTYIYATEGPKTITLTVTDEFGLSDEVTLDFMAQSPQQEDPEDEEAEEGAESESDEEEAPETYPTHQLINEILPNPEGADGEGEWIELFNSTNEIIDLSDWYLDDEEGASSPFQIPQDTQLQPQTYLVFKGLDLNLSLKNSDDVVRLLNPNKEEVERIEYTEAKEAQSYAKQSDDLFSWTSTVTPNAENSFPPPPKTYQKGDVLIDSALPNPEGADTGKEKIKLKNTTPETIDLSYWKIADSSSETELLNLSIPAYGIKELNAEDFKFSLNNSDESLTLYDPTGNVIDEISWTSSTSGLWTFNLNLLSEGMSVSVVEVVDGDTFKVQAGNRELTVRLIGVDTPETVHPSKPVEYYGKQASDFLKNLLQNQTVRLYFDERKTDSYGRVLAYVYLHDTLVNVKMIQEGYGYAYTRFPFVRLDEFIAYEEEARTAGRGLWADEDVVEVIEELIEENAQNKGKVEAEVKSIPENEEEIDDEDGAPKNTDEEKVDDELGKDCDSDTLKIDSFLAYAEKGVSEEFITLINTGDQPVCLSGWQLDDELEGGSKPFTIKEGEIAPGKTMEFGKEISKISLNNSNDCASLIRPNGELADQICYGKTSKGEILTHAGSAGASEKSSSKKTTSSSKKSSKKNEEKPAKHTFKRDSTSYRGELVNKSYAGWVVGFDQDEQVLVLKLDDEKLKPISYAHSLFDIDTIKDLADLSEEVVLDVYETPDEAHLISMHSSAPEQIKKHSWAHLFPFILIPVLLTGLIAYKKFGLK